MRAHRLGSAGKLSRLVELGGDPNESNVDRPVSGLDAYWRAPRKDDSDECELRIGSYSADNVCLQAKDMVVPALIRHDLPSPFRQTELGVLAALRSDFSDEYARRCSRAHSDEGRAHSGFWLSS